MSRPSDPQAAAFLDHIFSQTQNNISFLASHNYISGAEASELISRLNTAQSRSGNVDSGLASSIQALSLTPAAPAPQPSTAGRRSVPPPQTPANQARAVWGYNEDGREPNDLSFTPGEIIELVDENNADWWTGKCRGRQGLFPSNHVEKIASSTPYTSPPTSPPVHMPGNAVAAPVPYAPPTGGYPPPGPPAMSPGYGSERPMYKPFGATYQAVDQPPPPGAVAVNSVDLQQAPAQPPKKHRFGGRLGSTMANSAAGGVGFGAGAAIGSGIVNAIF